MMNLYKYENDLKQAGIKYIAGVDEVGRGPLAGPVVAAAVILPIDYIIEGIDDSKKLSEKKRELLYDEIIKHAVAYSVSFVDNNVIDKINIYEATKLAMINAINGLSVKPEHILIDAMPLKLEIESTSIIHGDALSASIGAASIIAKVTRDRYMVLMDEKYKGYGFKNHKGYGTKQHLEALEKLGVTDIHRKTYDPVKKHIIVQTKLDL